MIEQVARFLELEWSTEEIRTAIEINKPGAAGTEIPVYGEVARRVGPFVREPDGFVRTARVGGWKSDLSLLQRVTVWRVCRRVMKEVGYV